MADETEEDVTLGFRMLTRPATVAVSIAHNRHPDDPVAMIKMAVEQLQGDDMREDLESLLVAVNISVGHLLPTT